MAPFCWGFFAAELYIPALHLKLRGKIIVQVLELLKQRIMAIVDMIHT
jgi:hypothetical protein